MNVRELITRSASWLNDKGIESSRLEAELLLAHVLDVERLRLYLDADRPLIDAEVDPYRDLIKRRARGEPVAYLTGKKEFYGIAFEVTPDVLVPRPETELIVDRAQQSGLNPAGIDPRPEIERTRAMIQAESLVFREHYLLILDQMAERWKERS